MIDDKLARDLKRYRIFDLLIGIESGSSRILKMIDKSITLGQIIKAVKSLARYGVPASYSTIFGLPTETREEREQTIDLLYKIYKIHPQAGFTLAAYVPYPGSPLYDLAIKKGFKPPKKAEDWGKIDRFRKDIASPFTSSKQAAITGGIFVGNKLAGGASTLMLNYAIGLGSVTLINALVSMQYVFCLLYTSEAETVD